MPNTRTYLQALTKLEDKYQPKILAQIKAFRKAFIEQYKGNPSIAAQQLHLPHVHAGLAELLQAMYSEAGVFGAALTTRELKASAGRKGGGFGRNQRWIDAVNAFLKKHLLNLVQKISETMRQDILRVLQKAVDESLSINETVKEMEREDLMIARSRVIARTELVRASNVGHAVAAQDTPYEVNKKWSAARDHRTRHSHRDINGHTVDELDTFPVPVYDGQNIVGTDNMQYPGDASAHPSNTINCRCRVLYEPKRDSEGNLIMRRNATAATVVPMHRTTTHTFEQIAAQLKARIVMITEP